MIWKWEIRWETESNMPCWERGSQVSSDVRVKLLALKFMIEVNSSGSFRGGLNIG